MIAQNARAIPLLASTAAALLLISCSQSDQPKVLAQVGDQRITVDDFQREVERRRTARQPIPDKETLLQELTTFAALLQCAQKAGLAEDPQIQREIGRLLIGKLQERELAPQLNAISVSEEEVRTEYAGNLAHYTQPAKARLAILFLESTPKMTEARRAETRQRLVEARRQALANPAPSGRGPSATGFGSLAVDFSDDQASRHRGGDIGWLEEGNLSYRWPREVLEAGYALEKGQVSEILEAGGGLYLVMKSDSRAGTTTPFEQVQSSLTQSLTVKKHKTLEDTFREEARRLAGVQTDLAALAALPLSQTEVTLARHQPSGPPALPVATNPPHGH